MSHGIHHKASRSKWRSLHPSIPGRSHGGRGKKYGMKAGKQQKRKKSAM